MVARGGSEPATRIFSRLTEVAGFYKSITCSVLPDPLQLSVSCFEHPLRNSIFSYSHAITAWSRIVADGIMSSGGMVGFKDDLPPTRSKAIRALLINRAQAEAQAHKAQ
jgi:hypothetical protein